LTRRSTIALDGELVARLSRVAEKKKVARYSLANDCIATALRVLEEGGQVEDAYGSWRIMRLSREVGGFPLIPRSLVEGMASKLLASDKDWMMKSWYDEGVVFGGILKLRFQDPSTLGSEILRLLPAFSRRLDVQKNKSENGGGYSVNLVADFGEDLMLCLERFIQGVFSAFGQTNIDSQVSRNILRMLFQERKESV
jgi:hypothetical protein